MGLITLVIVSEQDGAIHNANGKSFLDKARYQVVSVVDTGLIGVATRPLPKPTGPKYCEVHCDRIQAARSEWHV
jgi:hypothetical protein